MEANKFHGQRFSIRDYTSKMRSIDVFKCWPFTTTRDVTRQDLQSWLPPMTPPSTSSNNPEPSRTHHHSDHETEEESAKSEDCVQPSPSPSPQPTSAADDEKLEMVCPVCREFNAATLTAVNAHIDACLAQSVREERRHMRIIKSKPPKKRSIAEIFKVEEEHPQPQQQQIESVLELWPLSEDRDDVSIAVTKLRWLSLSRRLQALRSGRGGAESGKSEGGGDAAVEEEEKLEMVCPVCRDFNAATVTAVNAHIDSCLAQAVREERRQMRVNTSDSKPKPKAPKKRSIAEILTVAPPVGVARSKAIEVEEKEEDNVDEESSDCGDEDDSSEAAFNSTIIKGKRSRNNNRKKKKTATMNRKSMVEKHGCGGVSLNSEKKTGVSKKNKKNKKKNKKKKMSCVNNEVNTKKEDSYKCKVQSPVNSSRKLKGIIDNKMVALQDIDPSVHKKKLGSNIFSVEKKQKIKISDSVGKEQKAVSPVCGLLKNHLKLVSGKISSDSNTRDSTEESHRVDQVPKSSRHMRFGGKDDILRPEKRNSFDETVINKSSDVLATSLVKEQSSGSDEEIASVKANQNYCHIAISIDKRKEACPIVESKQFSNTMEEVTAPNFLKPCTSEEKSDHSEEKSETLTGGAFCDNNNSQLLDGRNSITPRCSPYADISRPLSTVQEVQMSGTDTQVCESGAFSSIGKFIDHLKDPTFPVAAVSSKADTRTYLEPSSSYSTSYNKTNESPEFSMQTYVDSDNSGQALGDKQLSHMFSADMTDNSFPFTGWGKGSVRHHCMDQNFFGLPLNSHGELINFSSSGNVGMNQSETASKLRGSLSGLPVNNMHPHVSPENVSISGRHEKSFPKDGRNPFPHYPARLAVTELQFSEREDIHRPNSEMNIMRNSLIEQNQHDRTQNRKANRMFSMKESSDNTASSSSQPTVRLMGKDVAIGRSSKEMQQFVTDVWVDEESRRRNYSEYATMENSLLGRSSKQDWGSGSPFQVSTDNVMQPEKIKCNQVFPSTVLMNGPDSEFPQRFIVSQSNHVSQNRNLGVSNNATSYSHRITREHASGAAFDGLSHEFPQQFIPGAKPLGLGSRSQVPGNPCKEQFIPGAKPLGLGSRSQVPGNPCKEQFLPGAKPVGLGSRSQVPGNNPGNCSQPTCSSNGGLNDRNKNPHVTKSTFEFPFLQPAINEQAKASWSQRPYRSLPSWLSSSADERLPLSFSQQFSGISSQSVTQNIWGNNFTMPSVNHSAEVLYPSNALTSLGAMKTTPLCQVSRVQPLHVPVTPSTTNSGYRNINRVADRVKLDGMIIKDHHPCRNNTRKRPAACLDDSRKPIKLPNFEVQGNLSHMTLLTGENSSTELQRTTRAVELDPQVDSTRLLRCQNEAQNLNPAGYPAVDSFKLHGTVTSGPVRFGPGANHILKSS